MLISNYVDLLSSDVLIVHFRAAAEISTSVGEQIVRTYAAYKISANLHTTDQQYLMYKLKSVCSNNECKFLKTIIFNITGSYR